MERRAMRLGDWLRQNRVRAVHFAPRIGVDPSTLSNVMNKGIVPKRDTVVAIYVETAGAVEPNDFYDLPALPAPAEAPEAAAQ
jgi:hypothetical protein